MSNLLKKVAKSCIGIVFLFLIAILASFVISSILMPPSTWVDHPWNQSNLSVYINDTNLLEKDKQSYIYDALLALKWWEAGGNHRLSYGINFAMINNSRDANITINWVEKIGGGYSDGITDVNTSGYKGTTSCDTFNPPFTRCNISLVKGFDDMKTQKIIKHELGHALGLAHAFNLRDYFVAYFGENYIHNPAEIMFDKTVFDATNLMIFWIFIILVLISIFASVIQRLSKKIRK